MAPDDLGGAVHRRAVLLADPEPGPARRAELDELTLLLRRVLDSGTVIERVRLDDPSDPHGLGRRLAAAEPVNPVASEDDLRDRFDEDRRVFVVTHPDLPGRPLNVVWVALLTDIPSSLAEILDPTAPVTDPDEARVAAYYSIWAVEDGLAGLGRASELIEGVADLLAAEIPGLDTHVTLSPVPGFRSATSGDLARATPSERSAACAEYLCRRDDRGRPVDPVARFHLGNGARLLRICDGADPSARGRERSWGVMANYRYAPEDREANRTLLDRGGIALGDEVRALLGDSGGPGPRPLTPDP